MKKSLNDSNGLTKRTNLEIMIDELEWALSLWEDSEIVREILEKS